MKDRVLAVDLGSKFLKVIAGEEDDNGKINILIKSSHPYESFIDGEIIDQENFIEEVIDPLKEISEQLNERLRNIVISFSASYFNFQRVKAKTSVIEKQVTEEDIRKCLLLAKTSLLSGNYETIFEQTINFFLDGSNFKVRNPIGMEARNLEIDFAFIQGLKPLLAKIRDLFTKNDFNLLVILPNPLPASFIVLSKKEKEEGVILIDFGYKIFNLTIFQEGKLIFFRNFNFGVGDILEDLAIEFGLSVEEIFSLLKKIETESDKKKKISFKIGKQKLNYTSLVKLIEKKFSFYWKENGLHSFFKEIKDSYRLPSGIFLIGGGSYLPESENFFKKYSGYSTKKGFDLYNNLGKDESIFLNSLGLIFYQQRLSLNKNFLNTLKELFRNFFK